MVSTTIKGYYPEKYAKAVCKAMDGKTYYNFHVYYSNCMGNCSIHVDSNYEGATETDVREMFIACMVSNYAQLLING